MNIYKKNNVLKRDLEVQRKEMLLPSGTTQEGLLEDKVFDLSLKEWGISFKRENNIPGRGQYINTKTESQKSARQSLGIANHSF